MSRKSRAATVPPSAPPAYAPQKISTAVWVIAIALVVLCGALEWMNVAGHKVWLTFFDLNTPKCLLLLVAMLQLHPGTRPSRVRITLALVVALYVLGFLFSFKNFSAGIWQTLLAGILMNIFVLPLPLACFALIRQLGGQHTRPGYYLFCVGACVTLNALGLILAALTLFSASKLPDTTYLLPSLGIFVSAACCTALLILCGREVNRAFTPPTSAATSITQL